MARHARYQFPAGSDGVMVGASCKCRGGMLRAQFPHPTEPGKYIEAATRVSAPSGWRPGRAPPPDWHVETARLIVRAYAKPDPRSPDAATWETVEAELTASLSATTGVRPRTVEVYRTTLAQVRRLLPEAPGPSAVTPDLAQRFARLYAGEVYRRGKAADAPTYTRGPQTVWNQIANLSIVWRHLRDLNVVDGDPWAKVKRPRLPKRLPSVPTEDTLKVFFGWLDVKYPGWELMRVFLEVKMVTGRRLADLCQLRTDQFDRASGTLTIRPHQDKTHRELAFPLPPSLADRLAAVAGPVWLWERYVTDTATHRPGFRRETVFRPSLVYNAVKSVFKKYATAHPESPVRSHDLRKRAITLTTLATQNVDQTAQAIGIDPQTARKYYLDAARAFDVRDVLKRIGPALLPPDSGAILGRSNPPPDENA